MRILPNIAFILFLTTNFLQAQALADLSKKASTLPSNLATDGFPENYFLTYSVADGLPSNRITTITVDKFGFVWVGTENGLARYDGQRFQPLQSLLPASSDLPKNTISSLYADKSGNLWVRDEVLGLYKIDLTSLKIQKFINPNFTRRLYIFETETGDTWQISLQGVMQWEKKTQTFHEYLQIDIDSSRVQSTCKGHADFAWVATLNGFYRFDLLQKRYEKEPELDAFKGMIYSMTVDTKGHLWFSKWFTDKDALVEYDPYQRRVVQTFSKQANSQEGFNNTDIWDIRAEDNKIWFSTNTVGIYVYDTESRLLNHYANDTYQTNSLTLGEVRKTTRDGFGNIWIATSNMLHKIPVKRKTTEKLAHVINNNNSLINPTATVVFTVDKENMWIGTRRGLSRYNIKNKTFQSVLLPFYNNNDYNNQINTFEMSSDGHIWVGTWSGFFKLDKTSGRILEYYITNNNAGKNHPEQVDKLGLNAFVYLRRDKNGIIWAINNTNNLVRIDDSQKPCQFELIETLVLDQNKLNDQVTSIQIFDNEQVIIGTDDRLVSYDNLTKQFQTITIDFPESQAPYTIGLLSRLQSGRLLGVVNKKLYEIDIKNRKAVLFAPDFFLHTLPLMNITEDTEGGLWFFTESNIIQTDAQGMNIQVFDSKNFLNNNRFANYGDFKISEDINGNLYIPGMDGVTVLQPKALKDRLPAPKVMITDLKIKNQSVVTEGAIYTLEHLTLPYDQNSFTLEFSALGSSIPELNRFAYRLDGGEWVDLGNQSNVNFSQLSSGTYDFQIKAANSDGVWNEEGKRLRITIRPPWYRSWLAWLVYIGALGYGIYYIYQYQLRRRLADAELSRLKDLDNLKTRFFANISHELRTPLTLMLAPLSTMIKSNTLDNKNFTLASLVRQNAQGLLKLVNEILDLNKLEAKKLELIAEKTVVYNLIRRIIAGFESSAEVNQIDFTFDYQSDKYLQIWLDNNKFEKILNNLLSNAFKFTKPKGKVNVTVTDSQNGLKISISDTGRGIHSDDLPHIFNRFYQSNQPDALTEGGTGIGLSLSMELSKLMGGQLSVESTLGQGSTFTFECPKKEVMGTIPTPEAEEMLQKIAVTTEGVDLLNIKTTESSKGVKPTILIVEDNQSLRDYLSLILSTKYTILKAENGQVALEMLNLKLGIRNDELRNPNSQFLIPNLILSDVMMPIMDGFQLLSHLKSSDIYCSIPVVMLTARAELQDKLKALRIGVDDYLVKPFEEEELFVRIENLMRNAQLRQTIPNDDLAEVDGFTENTPVLTTEGVESETKSISTVDMAWLEQLEISVKKNLKDKDYSVERMASDMAMSRVHLFRKLKQLTGLSPQQYLQEVRLQQALHLLETQQEHSVKAVCYAVGLLQVNHFSQLFHQRFGKLPSSYLV